MLIEISLLLFAVCVTFIGVLGSIKLFSCEHKWEDFDTHVVSKHHFSMGYEQVYSYNTAIIQRCVHCQKYRETILKGMPSAGPNPKWKTQVPKAFEDM